MQSLSKAKILTATQLCALLGISRFKLKKWYVTYQLPIAEPFRQFGGRYSKYSYDDVQMVRDIVAEQMVNK